jgi:hypothetical protein
MKSLAVPSWVIPGTYGENLRFLESRTEIDTVELLFFLYDDEVRSLLDSEFSLIQDFARRFAYTAHLPDPLRPEHEELVARLSPLVRHFIVHPGESAKSEQLAVLLDLWENRYPSDGNGMGRRRFFVENTAPGRLEALLELRPASGICMDTGHLALEGAMPLQFFVEHENLIGEIHLHGIDREAAMADGYLPDHRALAGTEAWLLDMQGRLRQYSGVINMEVFSWAQAERTLNILRNLDIFGM